MTTLQLINTTSNHPVGFVPDASGSLQAETKLDASLDNMVFMISEEGVETEITAEMIQSKLTELRAAC